MSARKHERSVARRTIAVTVLIAAVGLAVRPVHVGRAATPPTHEVIEGDAELCPSDMALVNGEYCPKVDERCLEWLDDPLLPFARCAVYAKPTRCLEPRVTKRYCIDRYEYTRPGDTLPANFGGFREAERICGSLGKRVCTESEWNFACEGEEMRPYPYGYVREPICNQDRVDLFERTPQEIRLRDLREPADARPFCVSPFGVYDLVGNMDEPVLRDSAPRDSKFRNALKGGWWLPARNRCRAATTAHDDYYRGPQIGVRCCVDAAR